MTGRSIWVGLILTAVTPTIALSQGLEIDHKAVGCIVVGKYPKMNACFTPTANYAKGRVYFRPEGTPTWYYVDMKSDQPCVTGILPRPGKKLVGKHVEYYLEGQNKAFVPSRTEGYAPIVVKSAQECKKNIPVAPFLNNATVAVFPSVPAGFVGAGGIGTAAVVGIVGAGAAAATTTAIVVSNNNDDNTTTTIASSVNPTTTLATVTTTLVTTTTTLPKANKAPNAVLRTKPDPPQGDGPLTVIFDMCGSSDPDGDPLTFFFEFGDGAKVSGSSCVESHTYSASFREATAGKVKAQDSTYTFQGSAVDPSLASGSRSRTVVATKPAPACGSPSVSVGAPSCIIQAGTPTTVSVTVTANDPGGISNVTVKSVYVGNTFLSNTCTPVAAVQEDSKTATGGPPNFNATLNVFPPTSFTFGQSKCYDIGATVTNSCGTTVNAKTSMYLASFGCPPMYPYPVFHDVRRGMAWESDLQVEGGRLQVVVNGSAVSYTDAGRAYGMGAFVDGENRVEATLVDGRGRAGVWRFNFLASQSIADGSLRVIAGEAVDVSGSSISFRLKGTPGERVAFVFAQR